MAKTGWIAVVLTFFVYWLGCNVVINELMYDPIGTDTGYEWIELYNNGDSDINLDGSRIQVAGSSFTTVYTFPHYILRPGRFVLIGEQNITQAVFITPLVMQNGDTGTDAVRFISADGFYTDTVLYDDPNTNNLTDDYGNIGISFAPDVSPGFSLARMVDGLDTNNFAADFIEESNPTPGLPNRTPLDYSLSGVQIIFDEYVASGLECLIYNNSWAYSDTLEIKLEVRLNGSLMHSFTIPPISPWEYYEFMQGISVLTTTTGFLQVELVLYNDIDLSNNSWSMTLGNPQLNSLAINEILYNPETGNQEWIELYVPPQCSGFENLTITDAANNSVQISLPWLCPDYLVLCRDHASLLLRYPDCPPSNVLQVSSLPILNNDGDTILLKDNYGIVIDSISYIGVSSKKDISLERHVNQDSIVTWQYSYHETGGTPGQPNSEPPPPSELDLGSVKIVGSPFNPLKGESMSLQFNFLNASNSINCYVYDLKGIKHHTIASGLSVGNTGELVWYGKDKHGKPLPRGIYIMLVEAKNSSKHYFLRKQLTVVLATK